MCIFLAQCQKYLKRDPLDIKKRIFSLKTLKNQKLPCSDKKVHEKLHSAKKNNGKGSHRSHSTFF